MARQDSSVMRWLGRGGQRWAAVGRGGLKPHRSTGGAKSDPLTALLIPADQTVIAAVQAGPGWNGQPRLSTLSTACLLPASGQARPDRIFSELSSPVPVPVLASRRFWQLEEVALLYVRLGAPHKL